MTEPQKQELRDEFLNHRELAGQYGYCNPIMAGKISDFWLPKVEFLEQERIRGLENGIEKIKERFNKIPTNSINVAIMQVLSEVLSLLNK